MCDIRNGFMKRASIFDSLDIMPNQVRGNPKLQKVVNNILSKRLGTKSYVEAVEAVRSIINASKTKNKSELKSFADKYMKERPSLYNIIGNQVHS